MRTIAYLFEKSRQFPAGSLSLRLSVLEIYNEILIDLLRSDGPSAAGAGVAYSSSMAPSKPAAFSSSSSSSSSASATSTAANGGTSAGAGGGAAEVGKLNIVDTPGGVFIPSLYILPLASEEEAYSLILEAYSNRVVAEHNLNRRSSRSHVIYTIYVTRLVYGRIHSSLVVY